MHRMKYPHLVAAGVCVAVLLAGFAHAAHEASTRLRRCNGRVTEARVEPIQQPTAGIFDNGMVPQGYMIKILQVTN